MHAEIGAQRGSICTGRRRPGVAQAPLRSVAYMHLHAHTPP